MEVADKFRDIGWPTHFKSDRGPGLTQELTDFLESKGVKHRQAQ